MFDRDVLLLQSAAASLDPNFFLIHLLNKFGLIDWLRLVLNYTRRNFSLLCLLSLRLLQ